MLLLEVGQNPLPTVAEILSDRLCAVDYWCVVAFWSTSGRARRGWGRERGGEK